MAKKENREEADEQGPPPEPKKHFMVRRILDAVDLPEIYEQFIVDFPKEALRTEVTDKGETFSLYGYQFIVNRLNETVGIDHWHFEILGDIDKERKGDLWWVSLKLRLALGNWRDGTFMPLVYKEAFGSGISDSLGNAEKGATTNGLKKVASLFGIGKKAYEGMIEEFDNVNPNDKIVEAKSMLLTKDEQDQTKKLEVMFVSVSDKESAQKALAEYDKLRPSLNEKQIKYIDSIVGRLAKKFQLTLKI
jgi:hypothetical protein